MLNVIVTPRALRGKGKKIFRKVQSRLCESGTPHRFLYTERKGDATECARRLTEEGEREICVMGGDGAINDVLNGLTCVEECTLGVIPAGTGNDFAASARIPRGEKALELILGGEAKPTDYILFDDGRRALNIAGLGIDVDILRRCERMKRFRAKTKYFISLLVSLAKYRGCKIRVEVDGERREHTALIAAVCNGSRLGGGIPLCPPAGISDGLLDLVVVDCPKRSKIPGALVKLMRGKVLALPFTRHVLCTRAEICPDDVRFAQYDGEIYEADRLGATVVPGGLKIFRG